MTQVIVNVPVSSGDAEVRLEIHDGQGRSLHTLFNGVLGKGEHQLPFHARQLPTGTYHVVLHSGNTVITRSMLYVR